MSGIFTIVGAGFGLYGYLPAVINALQSKVVLADQYKETLRSRPELDQYQKCIEWQPSVSAALSRASGVIIATPPAAQARIVEQVLSINSIERLIIEKPVSPCPEDAIALTQAIIGSSKRFRIGYTFLYTEWYAVLKKGYSLPLDGLRITWSFKADHLFRSKETWKRYHSLGGGVLRFYGIHLIATLASLGYQELNYSLLEGVTPDQPEKWAARFVGQGLPPCEVVVLTNEEHSEFRIEYLEQGSLRQIHLDATPFALQNTQQRQDCRVPILERLICSFDNLDNEYLNIYQRTNYLWKRAELYKLG